MCGCIESVFNKVTNHVTDKVVGAIDPKNMTIKSLQETANKGRMYAVLIMIASIVGAIIGGALCSSILGSILGVPLLVVSISSFYGAYNAYRVCTNLKDHAAECVAIVKNAQNNYAGIKKVEGDQKNNDELTLIGKIANLFGSGKEQAEKLNAQQIAQRTHDSDEALKTIIKKGTVFFDVFGDSIAEGLLRNDHDEGVVIVNQH